MTTFDAIATIRRDSLPRTDALKYLMEQFGFSAIYADEIVAVVYGAEPAESVIAESMASGC